MLKVAFVFQVSMVFDICLGTEMRDGVCCVYPATKPASIRPYNLEEPLVAASSAGAKPPGDRAPSVTSKMPCQLYAPTWVVFQVGALHGNISQMVAI